MPRQLALLLCTGFTFYLLRYDRKQRNGTTWVLWIPTLWLLSIISRSVDAWFGVEGSRESGGVLGPYFNILLLCFGLITLARGRLNWPSIARQSSWLIVLVGYMLASTIWSDMPARSFRSCIKEVVAVVMAIVVLAQPAPLQAMESVLRRTVYILIPFSVLLIKYYPNLGVIFSHHAGGIQWIGVALQKNSLGQLCLVSSFFLVWTLVKRWRGREAPVGRYQTYAEVLLLLMTFWLFKGPSAWAASATSMVALSVGLATLVGLLWMNRHQIQLGSHTWVTIAACIIALGVITPFVGGSTVTSFTTAVGRDTTLTGRTEIWTDLVPVVMHQPFLGYGFSGFWNEQRTAEHDIGEAHNGYLDVSLQLGFVGLFLTAIFLLSCVRKAHRTLRSNFDWGCLCLCFVLMTATESFAESAIDSFERQMMAVVLFLSFSGLTYVKRPLELQPLAVPRSSSSVRQVAT